MADKFDNARDEKMRLAYLEAKKTNRPISDEEDEEDGDYEEDSSSLLGALKLRWIILGLVFVLAAGTGVFAAIFLRDKAEQIQNDRIQQEMIFARQEESLKRQEEALREQRKALEAEKRALEKRQRELEAQAERAAGLGEQMEEAERSRSSTTRIWEGITGRDAERKRQQQENEEVRDRSRRDAEEINRSIDEAAETLKKLNEKMAELEEMREKAMEMKDKAMKAYEENEETIHKMMSFFKSAVEFLGGLTNGGEKTQPAGGN